MNDVTNEGKSRRPGSPCDYVCSFDGDKNSDGGVFHASVTADPVRSFRREVPLPGQDVGFEDSLIGFGMPVLQPVTGDTYLTAYFDLLPEGIGFANRPGGRQEGVYVYDWKKKTMFLIGDTTSTSPPPPPGKFAQWTGFSEHVAVSSQGAFFVGSYQGKENAQPGQGIYRHRAAGLSEIVADPLLTQVPGRQTTFSSYRAVAANGSDVFFVGESKDCPGPQSASCIKGIYAYNLSTASLRAVIESGTVAPGGGVFRDFAVEPAGGINHSSLAANENGDLVMVAELEASSERYQGVFLMKKGAGSGYEIALVLKSGGQEPSLLGPMVVDSFNSVSINSRGEISFAVANTEGAAPQQGLVFYRDAKEGLLSVFKPGDTFLAEMKHPSDQYETANHGGMVVLSEALDSSPVPRLIFRHAYTLEQRVYSMVVIATLHRQQHSVATSRPE